MDAHLYACVDLDETRRRDFETAYSPQKSFSDYHELLADEKLPLDKTDAIETAHLFPLPFSISDSGAQC